MKSFPRYNRYAVFISVHVFRLIFQLVFGLIYINCSRITTYLIFLYIKINNPLNQEIIIINNLSIILMPDIMANILIQNYLLICG